MPIVNLSTSLETATQIPLDAKAYFKTLSSMTDLGANNFKAFKYYDGLLVLCIENYNQYIWRERKVTDGAGLLNIDFTYPPGVVSNNIDYSNRDFNFFILSETFNYNRIKSGVFNHVSGLDYSSSDITYVLNNIELTAPSTTVSIDIADNQDRIDLVVVNQNQQLVIVKGVPSQNPQEPTLDFQNQLRVAIIYVKENNNNPPVVDAGLMQTIVLSGTNTTSINLQAIASDSDGFIVSYLWEKISGPNVSIGNPNLFATVVNNMIEGNYLFKVTVYDNNSLMSSDTVLIVINPDPNSNTPPSIFINEGDSYLLPFGQNSLNINSTASDVDLDVLTYSWSVNNSNIIITNQNQSQASFDVSSLSAGDVFVATVTVDDGNGNTSSDSIIVTVGQPITIYQNSEQSQMFIKNDCAFNQSGNSVTYTVLANTYQSTVSQAAADQLAIIDINSNGQNYANTNGTCTIIQSQFQVTQGDCSENLSNSTWVNVYLDGVLGTGTTVYTDSALTIPYNGLPLGPSFRFRTSNGLIFDSTHKIEVNGLISASLQCSYNTPTTLRIEKDNPISNGGVFQGKLHFYDGEPNEVLNLSFEVFFDPSGSFNSASFTSPVSVLLLDNITLFRTGTVTLDSNGNATSNCQIADNTAQGINIIVTITGRSSQPIPTNDSVTINL